MNSRRDFLKLGSLALVGSLSIGSVTGAFGQTLRQKNELFPIPTEAADNFYLRKQSFDPLVETNFEIISEGISVGTIKLVEVENLEKPQNLQKKMSGESFLLIFEMRSKEKLDDAIYDLYHPVLGNFSMFISGVGRSGNRYQSVINRINLN